MNRQNQQYSTATKPPQKDKRLKVLDVTMKRNHYRQDSLIEVL
ncbi:MAG: NAD(P)H-dependent oxidoreductase subunit E, partial [Kamptonema sp. SIO4C4]|nr:NAD(P)H-dependent oxidoreductase subunit E [Kamptonema sp. SIO4C4]